jgi:recombinational DNA repair ATPase RecF
MSSTRISLNYWRCFEQQNFSLPNHSFLLVDENGSGKTSLLSAYYSLLTGKPWPASKWKDNLQQGRDYFGIGLNKDWSVTGKISPSGRLISSIVFPEKLVFPKVITYLPSDNYFLNLPRAQKLAVLDNSLGEMFDQEYTNLLNKLDRAVRSKSLLIKNYINENIHPDSIILDKINSDLLDSTIQIWVYRANFFFQLYRNRYEYGDWINSQFKDWQIDWEITNFRGIKLNIKKIDDQFNWDRWSLIPDLEKPNYFKKLLSGLDFNQLWFNEAAAGKVLFGGHRDDFFWLSKHQNATQILSRGEMRLLALYWKEIVRRNLPLGSEVIWLLDDLFNELDEIRENLFFKTVKREQDYIFATSTRKVNFELATYSLEQLKLD